ncbi:MAG TPA: class II aldolase/adducin family protein [Elusimicrobiota bacterium]|nr:class II aldolase/adducin family protein [Elusimicrobiota bacterium]
MWSDFFKFGRMLWEAGQIHYTSGNMSVRKGDVLCVTRTGSSLADLTSMDIVTVNLKDSLRDKGASSETPVHRALYKALPDIRAVVHSHPPYATALSFDMDEIVPADSDSLFIPSIPVLTECPFAEGSTCVADRFPALLKQHRVAVIRGHGAFAVGDSLRQCIATLTMMENQCRLVYLRRTLKRG